MDKQYFNCPHCGGAIVVDSWDDIFDTSADTINGTYTEYAAYTCPHCKRYVNDAIVVSIHYDLKFNRVEIE